MISSDGDSALIGARADDDKGSDSGSAYVFTLTGGVWTQEAKLLPADGAAVDNFGISVSLDGNSSLIGAFGDDDMGSNSGSAYVFTRTGGVWTQEAKLLPADGAAVDNFGWSVSLDGDTALIGAYSDDDKGSDSGSAYIFTRTGGVWILEAKLLSADGAAVDNFGWSVSLEGDTTLIGVPFDADNGSGSGSAYVLTLAYPYANADNATANDHTPLNIDVLANDVLADGTTVSIDSVTQPAHGSVVIEADDTVRYISDNDYSGLDTFTYSILDSNGGTDTATVTVQVYAPGISNLVTNGSFEEPVIIGGLSTYSAGSTVMPAWTVTAGSIDHIATHWVASDGAQSLDMSGGSAGTITQVLNTIQGAQYNLFFDMSRNSGAPSIAEMQVDVAGVPQIFSFNQATNSTNMSWQEKTLTFTATGTNETLVFTSLVNSPSGPALDNVRVIEIVSNSDPVADNDTYSTDEDTALNVSAENGVLANDTDDNGDSLSAINASAASHGTVTLNIDGSFTYTPIADYKGADSFTYDADDGNGGTDTATVSIAINPINDEPIAEDQNVTTDEDTLVNITLGGTDVDEDSLIFAVVDSPAHGSLGGSGLFLTYTPDADYTGSDSFTFKINDGTVDSALATVSITVDPINDAPTADKQNVSTDEDTALPISLTGSDIDGDDLTYEVVDAPTNGVLSGTLPNLTYTPDADFNGADSFTFKVNDGTVDSALATISITVNPTNDAPTADNQNVSTDEDTALPISLTGSDIDGDDLTYEVVDAPTNGVLSGVEPNLTYTPDADFNGADSFTFKVNDALLDSNIATIAITINPINDAPVPLADSAVTDEDSAVTIDALNNDSDPDGDSLTIIEVESSSSGSASIVNNEVVYTPNLNFNGNDLVIYTVSDGQGGSGSALIAITVNAVNDDPMAVADAYSTDEDGSLIIAAPGVLGNDSDVELDSLSVSLLSEVSHGSLSLNGDGSFSYTPTADYFGQDSFSYTLSDGNGGSDSASVSITINAINDDPIALADAYSMDEDTSLLVAAPGVLSNDSDIELDSLSVSFLSDVSHGSLTLNLDGSFSYTPTADYFGQDSFSYTLSDGNGGSDSATVTINIADVPDGLQVLRLELWNSTTDVKIRNLNLTDSINLAETPDVNVIAITNPATVGSVRFFMDGSFVKNENDAPYALAGDNNGNFNKWNIGVGNYLLSASPYSAKGGGGTVGTSLAVNLSVINDPTSNNTPPTMTQLLDQSNTENDVISLQVQAQDVDNDTLFYNMSGQPAGLNINLSSGLISGTIEGDAADNSPYTVTVSVFDGIHPLATSMSFQWIVEESVPVNTAPQVNAGADASITLPTNSYQLQGSVLDTTPTLTLTSNWTGPDGVVFANASDPASLVTLPGAGSYILTLTASDGDLSSNDSVTITVLPQVTGPAIVRLELWNSTTDVKLRDLNPTDTINLAHTPDVNVIAISNPAAVGSVRFFMDGSLTRNENEAPYAIAGDNNGNFSKWNIGLGSYVLSATPYSAKNGGGTAGASLTVNLSVINEIVTVNQPPVVPNRSFTIQANQSFEFFWDEGIYDPEGDTIVSIDIGDQPDHGQILGDPPGLAYFPDADFVGSDSFSIVAEDSHGNIGTGTVTVTVNAASANQPLQVEAGANASITLPTNSYALQGIVSDDGLPSGTLTIQWTGTAGVSFADASNPATTASFAGEGTYILTLTVGDGELTTLDTVTIDVLSQPATLVVTKLELWNASTDTYIRDLTASDSISLAVTPQIAIVAITNPATVGGVQFKVDGVVVRTEGGAPYALAGDQAGNYNPWNISSGTYVVTATAYEGKKAAGNSGTPLNITLTISN